MPGSPLANAERLSEAQQKMIEAQYGLDKPIFIQYVTYLWDALHFDFGVSFQFANQEVSTLIAQRMGPSAQLGICLLYTSDAADEEDSVDLGGRRIYKKKQKQKN